MVEWGAGDRVSQGDVKGCELLVDASAVRLIHGGAKKGAPAEVGVGPAGGSRGEGAAAGSKRREVDGEERQVVGAIRVRGGGLLHGEAEEAFLARNDGGPKELAPVWSGD